MPLFSSLLACMLALGLVLAVSDVAYTNPILPGWHSDPSCIFVAEFNETYFCSTSSFLDFPGNPIYASQDLIHWKLASNALSRISQMPDIQTQRGPEYGGMFANTLRFHNGTFYLISAWADDKYGVPLFVLFQTTNPFDASSWSDVKWVQTPGFTIDPDLFFDDDGSVVVASSGSPIIACFLDIATGNISETWTMWNGTGGSSQEGPHLYKKDGYYYLMIAEGGTQLGHAATVARSTSLRGPWEASPSNPLVSNAGTDEYFQTVGHADLFQDAAGNWWGVALSTRGGPALYDELIFPMGKGDNPFSGLVAHRGMACGSTSTWQHERAASYNRGRRLVGRGGICGKGRRRGLRPRPIDSRQLGALAGSF